MTTQEFIKESIKIHGNKYDYSKVEYKKKKEKVCIICPEHGEFWQTANAHLNGCGCRKCSQILNNKKRLLTTEQFIEKARKVHGDKYDYSKVEYVNNHTKVCIICPEHGEFWINPNNHLKGSGCKKCCYQYLLKQNQKMTQEAFIEKAKKLHGDKYDYSKTKYVDAHTKVCIICPKHGEFWITAGDHIRTRKTGCGKCGRKQKTTEEFIEKARKIHGDKYDYSNVNYEKDNVKVCITCPKHGEFWQTPFDHLHNHGCPKCKQSKLEYEISMFLNSKNINYIYEADKKELKWLKSLKLDFYLPDYNAAIECQGKQHFKQVHFFDHDGDDFEKRIKRDKRKLKLCTENGIKIYYYSNLKIDYPYKVYENKNELLNDIVK